MSTIVFMKNDPKQLVWKVVWKLNGEYKVCRIDEEQIFQTNVIPISHAEEFDKLTIQHVSSAKQIVANKKYHQCISKEFFDDIQPLIPRCKRIYTTYKVVRNDGTESEHDYTDDSVDFYMKDIKSCTIDGVDLKEKYSGLSAFPVVLVARRYILERLTEQREWTIRRKEHNKRRKQFIVKSGIKRNLEKDIQSDPVCKKVCQKVCQKVSKGV